MGLGDIPVLRGSDMFALMAVPFVPRSASGRHHQANRDRPPSRTVLLSALAGVLVYNLAQGIAWTNLFLIGIAAELKEQRVANPLFASQVVAIGGALAAITLAERVGRMRVFVAGILGGVACIGMLIGNPTLIVFLLAACGFNFLWNMVMPFILGAVNEMDRCCWSCRSALSTLHPPALRRQPMTSIEKEKIYAEPE